MSLLALFIAVTIGAIFGWLMRDATIPVPESNSPDGSFAKEDDGY
jgi:hypothetical protein